MVSSAPALKKAVTPKWCRYIPYGPSLKQAAFLALPHKEVLYGGAAGGGKSVALLMAALQYFDVPGYNALLIRRTIRAAKLADSLIDLAEQWLAPHIGRRSGQVHYDRQAHTFTSPEGATLTIGHIHYANDVYAYQGPAFHFIGVDELTQLPEWPYRYLFSRLRRKTGFNVPLRMRATANPGGMGHIWVKARFVTPPPSQTRCFLPANLHDNEFLDSESYLESLAELELVIQKQLEEGDWDITVKGEMFDREMFTERIIPFNKLPELVALCRYWDLAATEPSTRNPDPDYTAGALIGIDKERTPYILDIRFFRKGPSETEAEILKTAEEDYAQWGHRCRWRMEQEGGASGKTTINTFTNAFKKLGLYSFEGVPSTTNKPERARAVATVAGRKCLWLVDGMWVSPFIDEAVLFPTGTKAHDDKVDAVSGAFNELLGPSRSKKIRGQ
jgi:predicted phage terminase large subunit-like protein